MRFLCLLSYLLRCWRCSTDLGAARFSFQFDGVGPRQMIEVILSFDLLGRRMEPSKAVAMEHSLALVMLAI